MTIRPYGLMAVKHFTLEQIHAAKPSDGWNMQDLQAKAAAAFPHWAFDNACAGEMSTVEYEVKKAVFEHCNITSHFIPENAENSRNKVKTGIVWKINGEELFFNTTEQLGWKPAHNPC